MAANLFLRGAKASFLGKRSPDRSISAVLSAGSKRSEKKVIVKTLKFEGSRSVLGNGRNKKKGSGPVSGCGGGGCRMGKISEERVVPNEATDNARKEVPREPLFWPKGNARKATSEAGSRENDTRGGNAKIA